MRLALKSADNAAKPASREPSQRLHKAQCLTVPLATLGRLDADTLAIYEVLGLRELVYVDPKHGETVYATTWRHLNMLRNAVEEAYAPGGSVAQLAARTTSEPLAALSIPVCQPRVTPARDEIYRALGVDTVVIEHGGAQYTVIADAVEQALDALSPRCPAPAPPCCPGEDPSCTAARAAARVAPPHRAYPAPDLRLASHYVGEPSPVVRILAKMYGVRFARVLDSQSVVYWIPFGSATTPSVEETIQLLGLGA